MCRPDHTITGRIFALFVFANIVSLVVSLIQTVSHAHGAEQYQYANAEIVATAASSEIEVRLANLVGLARTIERLPGFWDAPDEDRDAWLGALVASQPEFNALAFVTPDLQQHRPRTSIPARDRPNLSSRRYATEALTTHQVTVAGEPLQALGGTERVLPVAIPVQEQTADGHTGLIVGSLRLDRLPGVWGATPLPPGSGITLVDTRSGRILAGTGDEAARDGRTIAADDGDGDVSARSAFQWWAALGAPDLRAETPVDGTPWVVTVVVPAKRRAGTDLRFGVAVRPDSSDRLRDHPLLVGSLLRRTLLVRLGDLAHSARRWSHGEWDHRAGPTATTRLLSSATPSTRWPTIYGAPPGAR